VENEGRFQAPPPDAYSVRVRLGRSIQRLRGTHPAIDSKKLRDFARLPTTFNSGFEPRSINKRRKKLKKNTRG